MGKIYPDIPLQTTRRRPSLDSTYSELSELSIHSGHHPLLPPSPDHVRRSASLPSATPHHRRGIRHYLDAFWLHNKGVVLVLLAMVFGSGMNVATRLMETDGSHGQAMHPFQILLARMSITVLLSLLYGFYTHIPHFPFGPAEVRLLLIVRGVGGFFGVFGLYSSLLYLPLAEATVLTFLAPILTCYACSLLIRGETFTRQQQMAGFLSLVGVVFIARPGSLFVSSSSPSSSSADDNVAATTVPASSSSMYSNTTSPASLSVSTSPPTSTPTPTSHQHLLAVLFAMIGVLGATTAMTTIRKIGTRAHPLISVNYFSSWCTIVSLVAVLALRSVGFRLPGNVQEWGLLLMLGVFGFVMQFLLTAGLAYGGPGSGSGSGSAKGIAADLGMDLRGGNEGVGAHAAGRVDEESGGGGGGGGGGHDFNTRQGTPTTTKHSTGIPPSAAPPPSTSGTRATSMLYTQMLFALAFDKCIWGLSPAWSSWVGSVIILACAVWVAAARDLPKKPEGNDPQGGHQVRGCDGD